MEALQERHLETINEIARIATLDLELRPMMQRITDALAQKFSWDFVALVIVYGDRTAFVCEAVTSSMPTEIRVGYSRPLGSGVVGMVATTERPILIDDVREYPNYVETMPGARSELCVPVIHSGRLVAIVNLESKRLGAFHDQLPLLMTVADQIAGAIANARLFEETRRRAALMEMMSEVTRTALEAIDLGELLQRIVHYVHQRFPVALVEIRLEAVTGYAQAGASACDTQQLVVPIRFRGETLGELHIESCSDEVFTPESVLAFESLAGQVAGAIHLASMKASLEQANEQLTRAIETLHRLSTTDPLTGAANRRQFDDAIDLEWRRAARTQSPLTLMMIDIDHFKAFNDALGHQAGDDCLRRVAEALQQRLHRAGDLVARYGGEEFAVLVTGIERAHARELAEALRAAVEHLGLTTISIGVAHQVPHREAEPEELIRTADDALYGAKKAGRNCVVVA
jgi:diguanylate cyclase (GGDEF)-like protein